MEAPEKQASSLVFVGSGSSSGVPRIPCLMQKEKPCVVCFDALREGSKNRRRNPSVLIRHKGKNILIDCGKTFRESIMGCILKHDVRTIHAVVLTHAHADAILGLDDLREFTEKQRVSIYVRQSDMPVIRATFPYLVDVSKATGSGYVSSVDFVQFDDKQPFVCEGVEFHPLIVEHGPQNTALGFRFGDVAYISDVSKIPDDVRSELQRRPPDLLVIDSLRRVEPNASHFSFVQAFEEIKLIRPKKALIIGMSHDFHFEEFNEKLRTYLDSDSLDIALSWDGMVVDIDLP